MFLLITKIIFCIFTAVIFVATSSLSTLQATHHVSEKLHTKEFVPFALKENRRYKNFVFRESVFSAEECQRIILYGLKNKLEGATVTEAAPDLHKIRKARVAWLAYDPEIAWVFDRLESEVRKINQKHYKFKLAGFYESLQFTEYLAPDSHYTWHIDFDAGAASLRKLSIVIQLSPPEDYEGGNLEIFDEFVKSVPKKQGALVCFPSFVQHCVTPVTKGKRYTLVVWVSGDPFQ